MPNPPSAAKAVYPHLASGERPEVQQRTPNTPDAMFPNLSREVKAREADQRWWEAKQKAQSKQLAADLRAIVAEIRAEKARRR